jgi:hypothetical protein
MAAEQPAVFLAFGKTGRRDPQLVLNLVVNDGGGVFPTADGAHRAAAPTGGIAAAWRIRLNLEPGFATGIAPEDAAPAMHLGRERGGQVLFERGEVGGQVREGHGLPSIDDLVAPHNHPQAIRPNGARWCRHQVLPSTEDLAGSLTGAPASAT